MLEEMDWFVFWMTLFSRLCWTIGLPGAAVGFILFQLPIFIHFKKDEKYYLSYFLSYILVEWLFAIPILILCSLICHIIEILGYNPDFYLMFIMTPLFGFLQAIAGSKVYYFYQEDSYFKYNMKH